MLSKYNNYRTFRDNLQLGILTSFSAGMVNVISVILFFAFTSNVTGHYAILAQEISKGNWYQAAVVFVWISIYMGGAFTSSSFVIRAKKKRYLSHVIPIIIEVCCLLTVAVYMQFVYDETLSETEFLVGILLYAMGIQNGLTASISNFSVKTTHLTGLTTDLGILLAMLTKKVNRDDAEIIQKTKLLLAIMLSYMFGGILCGILYSFYGLSVFYMVCVVLSVVMIYDYYKLKVKNFILRKQPFIRVDMLNRNSARSIKGKLKQRQTERI
jgi:uncharacterized membrane protein YoaK (UPF0700 family)